MKIRHLFSNTSSRHELETIPAFLLRNQVGDMLSFYTERQTRYEGLFVRRNDAFFKLLERVEVLDAAGNPLPVIGITNTGFSIFWEYEGGLKLGFKLLNILSGLTVRASQTCRLRINLDTRGIYAHPDFGRSFKCEQNTNGLAVTYKEGKSSTYLHLRAHQNFDLTEKWVAQKYPRDTARNSAPDTLYTFELGTVETDSLTIGYGDTPEDAARISLAATKQRPTPPPVGISHTLDTLVNHVNTARSTVNQALRWLETSDGLWAGLPWFHQVWARDELITGLGLNRSLQHELIDQYVGRKLYDGELETFIGSKSSCSDGVGWLCLLVREFGEFNLSHETRERLLHFLLAAHKGLVKKRLASNGLIRSGHNSTWMDTIGREGYPLEIQCMYALLLDLLYSLTEDVAYEQERLKLLGIIRQYFWQEDHLSDMLDDTVKRPNVFLAYLCQPDLLTAQLWQKCFDTTLAALKTNWGGLTSVDQSDPRFHSWSSGQDNQSYHNGDSWFFINNLVAVALQRLNQRRYGTVITGILESSTDEVLWHNMIGHPGEISSAQTLQSWGCGSQAFSGGTYLMLVRELEGYSAGQDLDSTTFFWDSTADSTADISFK